MSQDNNWSDIFSLEYGESVDDSSSQGFSGVNSLNDIFLSEYEEPVEETKQAPAPRLNTDNNIELELAELDRIKEEFSVPNMTGATSNNATEATTNNITEVQAETEQQQYPQKRLLPGLAIDYPGPDYIAPKIVDTSPDSILNKVMAGEDISETMSSLALEDTIEDKSKMGTIIVRSFFI